MGSDRAPHPPAEPRARGGETSSRCTRGIQERSETVQTGTVRAGHSSLPTVRRARPSPGCPVQSVSLLPRVGSARQGGGMLQSIRRSASHRRRRGPC